MLGDDQQSDVRDQSAERRCTHVIRIPSKVLLLVCRKGDATSVAAVRAHMHEPDSGVRLSAVKSLSLIEKGARVVADLSAMLGDNVSCVRSAALESFIDLLGGEEPARVNVRHAALHVVLQSQFSLSKVANRLVDEEVGMSVASLCALVKGDRVVFPMASGCLLDPEVDVRLAALQMLCDLSHKANEEVILSIAMATSDNVEAVRLEAMRSLARVACRGSRSAVAAVIRLCDRCICA